VRPNIPSCTHSLPEIFTENSNNLLCRVKNIECLDWENDVLGRFVLPSGYTKHVTFSRQYPDCEFDVKVVFRDGTSLTDWDVDLCRVGRVIV
jgi:hypothetical protein